jgi:hypothetical protein
LKLIQVIWRKIVPGETAQASASLNDRAYEIIVHRRFELAITMLQFGLGLKNTIPENVRRMMIVNLANAYKLSGDVDKARLTLDGHDWSAASTEFQICIAAVKHQVDEVCSLLAVGACGGKHKKK